MNRAVRNGRPIRFDDAQSAPGRIEKKMSRPVSNDTVKTFIPSIANVAHVDRKTLRRDHVRLVLSQS